MVSKELGDVMVKYYELVSFGLLGSKYDQIDIMAQFGWRENKFSKKVY